MFMKKGIFIVLVLCVMMLISTAYAATEHPGLITITSGQSVGDGSYINHNDSGYPFIMHFTLDEATMPLKSCTLGISSWDCDEDSTGSTHEWDTVFVNGTCVGVLTGQDGLWKTSYFNVPLDTLKIGENKIVIYVGHKDNYTGETVQNTNIWLLEVKQAFLQFDGGKDENAPESFKLQLTSAEETATGISCTASAQIQSQKAHSYVIEYSLVDLSINQIIADDEENVSGTKISSVGHFYLPSDAHRGNYRIEATLRDNITGMVYASAVYNFNLEKELAGACEHKLIGQREYVNSNYYKLKKDDMNYNQYHEKVDTYQKLCSVCGEKVKSYDHFDEKHTHPVCVCGFVQEGYNPIISATLTPMGICCAGQEFKVEVVTHGMVERITATNDVGTSLNESKWKAIENADGTRTFFRIYKADLPANNRIWTVKAYNNNGRYLSSKNTNSVTIYKNEKEAGNVSGILVPSSNVTVDMFQGEMLNIAWTACEGASYYVVELTDTESKKVLYETKVLADEPLNVSVGAEDIDAFKKEEAQYVDYTLSIVIKAFQ